MIPIRKSYDNLSLPIHSNRGICDTAESTRLRLSITPNFKMAKGLRSSTKKANKAILRHRIFGPVEDARKERLSVKLLEVASKSQAMSKERDIKMIDCNRGLEGNFAIGLKITDGDAQNLQSRSR